MRETPQFDGHLQLTGFQVQAVPPSSDLTGNEHGSQQEMSNTFHRDLWVAFSQLQALRIYIFQEKVGRSNRHTRFPVDPLGDACNVR